MGGRMPTITRTLLFERITLPYRETLEGQKRLSPDHRSRRPGHPEKKRSRAHVLGFIRTGLFFCSGLGPVVRAVRFGGQV